MRYTNKIKLMLPDVGSTQNWGTAINYNFQLLDNEIQKVFSELETAKNIVGAGVPYYRELYSVNGSGPYKFLEVEVQNAGTEQQYYNFKYYTNINQDGGVGDPLIYTTGSVSGGVFGLNDLGRGVGAYLINTGETEIALTTGDTQTYYQGDLLVAISEVGSIYDSSYVNIKFAKYPDTGHYIEPEVKVENNAAIIKYTDKNYIDWTLLKGSNKVGIRAIPAFHYWVKDANSEVVLTFTDARNLSFGVQVEFYIENGSSKTPYYVAYDVKIEETIAEQQSNYTVTIKPEQAVSGGKMCVYVGRNITAAI